MASRVDAMKRGYLTTFRSVFVAMIVAFFSFPVNLSAQSTVIAETRVGGTEYASVASQAVDVSHDMEEREHFSYVITAEQLQLFSDRTLEEAIIRIAGVQARRQGGFNIRGTGGAGRGLYNVTINGQRMATTGKGHRSINLGSISTDMTGELQVLKVITPDKDADALGGLININTRRAMPQGRQLNVVYGGGFDSGYRDYIRPESRASVNYSEAFSESVSLSAGFTHQRNNHAWENLGIAYDVADFGNGNVDVIDGISTSLNTSMQNNFGGYVVFNYQPSLDNSYYIKSYFNSSSQDLTRHGLSRFANGDWISQNETGASGRQGTFGYDIFLQDQTVNQVIAQAGAGHHYDAIDLRYRLGWSHSKLRENQIFLPFLLTGLDYQINMDDMTRPNLTVIDRQVHRSDMRLQPMNEVDQEHVENTFTGNVDVDIPLASGYFRVGTGAVLSSKDGDFRDTILRFRGAMNLAGFQIEEDKMFSVFDRNEYMIPWYVKPENARKYFEYNRAAFIQETALQRRNSDIWNYTAMEGVYSGYGMASWNIGRINVLGGVRVEHTQATYEGNNVRFNNIGFYASTTDTTVNRSYTHLFPNVQLKLPVLDQMGITAAWSRTIARPDFHDVTPFRLVDEMDSTLFRGNPRLDPMISDNLDLLLEYQMGNLGSIGIGLFYKNISNFVVERTGTVTGGVYDGFTERTYEIGGETADIYGVEFSWQQNFNFLPGFLGNFGTLANYTWTHSSYSVDFREGDNGVRMPGQSPHVVNAALNYRQGRFVGQVAYHWTAESVVYLAETQSPAPSVSGLMYRDQYEDGFSDLSVSARFRISQNFRLWADATNLLRDERTQFTHSRSFYPVDTYLQRSSVIRLGLRFDL